MSYRTNPDRILDNIDRARNRDAESVRFQVERQAMARDLNTDIPDLDATNTERLKRIFASLERAYTKAAQRTELGRLASRFQAVGDIHHHHARGDVSISVQYMDHERFDDVGVAPFELRPSEIADAKKETKTSRTSMRSRCCVDSCAKASRRRTPSSSHAFVTPFATAPTWAMFRYR